MEEAELISDTAYLVAWDPVLKVATRMQDKDAKPEFTKEFEMPADPSPYKSMIGVWPDGWRHDVASLTVAQWTAQQGSRREHAQASRAGAGAPPIWSCHEGRLEVRHKADIRQLVYLKLAANFGGNQLVAERIEKFKSVEDANAAMIKIGKEAEKKGLGLETREGIHKIRNRVMAEWKQKDLLVESGKTEQTTPS